MFDDESDLESESETELEVAVPIDVEGGAENSSHHNGPVVPIL